jgi:hypothetical protein
LRRRHSAALHRELHQPRATRHGLPGCRAISEDAINNCVVHGQADAVNPDQTGTKAAAHYRLSIGGGQSATVRLRLTDKVGAASRNPFGAGFDDIVSTRAREADEFYKSITPPSASADEASVLRQAIGGMLWSKQFYYFDADNWLEEHHAHPLHHGYRPSRNTEWFHMVNKDIISMPDKWEYPWYAAWDLAFHTLPIAIADPTLPKSSCG